MTTISVIVPVYKVELYLHRCVDSILGQTFTDFELILVDDGSPDNCPDICDEYAAKDSRVHVIHQENGGLSAARNAGIDWTFANSDSQWLSFVDSDDWVHVEYLERLMNAAIEHNVSVSVCGLERTSGDFPIINEDDCVSRLWDVETFYVKKTVNAIVAWGKLYRKECFTQIRYPVEKLHEDEFTTYQILFKQKQVAVIDAPLYSYFENSTGITRSRWNPRRLVSIEAKHQQINFFKQHDYQNAYERASFSLLWNIASHIKTIEAEEDSKYLPYVLKLRPLLRKEIRKNKQLLSLSLKKNYDLYEVAYPTFMKYYWIFQVVLKKLRLRK